MTQTSSDTNHQRLDVLDDIPPKRSKRLFSFIDKSSIVILGLIVVTYFIFITLPLASIFLKIDHTQIGDQLQNWQVISAIQLSLYTSAIAALLTFILAVPSAYFMATRKFPGKTIIDTILDLPIVLPPAVAGIALLYAFAPRGVLGPVLTRLGITLPGFTVAVIIAEVFVSSPFLFRAAKTGFENQDPDIYNSARILSGSRIRVFLTITLPLTMRGIISGTLLTWTRAMGEFGATLMFAGNLPGETATMPLAIYTLLYSNPSGAIMLSIILIVLSFTVLVIVKLLEQKRFGAKK
ncbi:ABC transporter permease [Candidatus Bathycorpusculum sp.]|uniref:ABC transporter permease n=1 Tax=Candidatus Bathycorpusculum sp. TaxID=2994959 RepID=UPI0031CC3A5D